MSPYRSDLAGRLSYYIHHRPTTCAAIVLAVILVPVLILTAGGPVS